MNGQDYDSDDMFFCVEASNNPRTDAPPLVKFFPLRDEAMAFAEENLAKWKCILVAEKGEYESLSGTFKRDWIYFWWNQPAGDAYEWNFPPPGQSTGYPESALTRFVEYAPLQNMRKR